MRHKIEGDITCKKCNRMLGQGVIDLMVMDAMMQMLRKQEEKLYCEHCLEDVNVYLKDLRVNENCACDLCHRERLHRLTHKFLTFLFPLVTRLYIVWSAN